MKTVEYYKKNVYGVEHMYIKDKKLAEAIQTLTNQKTISERHIKALESLGFKFVQVLP